MPSRVPDKAVGTEPAYDRSGDSIADRVDRSGLARKPTQLSHIPPGRLNTTVQAPTQDGASRMATTNRRLCLYPSAPFNSVVSW